MDSVDLESNNIPWSWCPRVRWYETRVMQEFNNHFEKCKGLQAKEAYLNRKVV